MLIRALTRDDLDASIALGSEAFGAPPTGFTMPDPADFPFPGRHSWGCFDDGGALLGRAVARDYHSFFRGAEVATCGIAGVAFTAEHRGRGLLGALMGATLEDAATRGQVISTLFPTAPGIYRRFGWELVSSYDTVEVPTAALTAVRPVAGTTVRRAVLADIPAIRQAYAAWAVGQNGPLTRTGPSFGASDEDLLGAFTAITVAEHPEQGLVGYAMWQRGQGYDATATIEVEDMVALTPDAARALWQVLGSFASVTGRVRVASSGDDLTRLVLPFQEWEVVERHPYMLRVSDVAGALAALPLAGTAALSFRVAGDPIGTMDGGYRLEIAEGEVSCERVDVSGLPAGVPELSPQGLALAYAGMQSAGNLRIAGHLTGGDAGFDATLDALLGGRQMHIRDYF